DRRGRAAAVAMGAHCRRVDRLDGPGPAGDRSCHAPDQPNDRRAAARIRSRSRGRRSCARGGPVMSDRVLHMLWTPLAPSPLLWLAVTLAAYLVGRGGEG